MDRVVKKGFQVLPTVSYLCLHSGFNVLIRRTERETFEDDQTKSPGKTTFQMTAVAHNTESKRDTWY